MTFQELCKWSEDQGRSETDVLYWYALSEVQSIRDMTDSDLAEMLVSGIKYDREYVTGHWEGLDEDDQKNYRMYMTDSWKGQ